MELGEKIRAARLEAGLSQRQLCGEEITRNMLSQIENGSAQPSMKTLQYLAAGLGKSVSYFLEEDAVLSPNQQIMQKARLLFDAGMFPEAAETLSRYREPDEIYDREKALLSVLIGLSLAEQALRRGKRVYAGELLEKLSLSGCYCETELRRKYLLLLGQTGTRRISGQLPSLDAELLLRAEEAFSDQDLTRAARLLDAAEDQTSPEWNLLRGQVCLAQRQYRDAAQYLHAAEAAYPRETAFRLEHCYRELEDYKRAYEYACKQK